LTREVENFWFSPDREKVILLETERDEESWALKIYDLGRNVKSHLVSEVDIDPDGASLLNLEFSEDSKELYLDIETVETLSRSTAEEQKKTFILKLDRLPPQIAEKEVIPPPEDIVTSKEYGQDVYYLDNSGYLFKNDLKVSETSFPVQPEAEYNLEIFSNFIFLREEQNVYLLSSESGSFEKFFDGINSLKLSPNNRKLAFFSNSEIWILFLEDDGRKKTGDKLFLVRLSEKIDDVFWLNSDYLIFKSGNNLRIVETDERDRIQVWDVNFNQDFSTEIEIYSNENSKKLYILNEGDLFVSEKFF
jgi:hypothetical protein